MSLVSPALATPPERFVHLWKDHIKPAVLTLVYSKEQSNARYYTKWRLFNKGKLNKPSNPVDWTKLKGVPAGLADGRDAGKYARVVVVAKSGGDFTDPRVAMNSIKDASSSKHYLLYIAPGTYNLGTSEFRLKAHVDVSGAGRNATTLAGGDDYLDMGFIRMADDSELRDLSVAADSSSRSAVYATGDANVQIKGVELSNRANALWVTSGATALVENSILRAGGPSSQCGGCAGIYATSGSTLTVTNSTLSAAGGQEGDAYGLVNFESNVTIVGSTLKGVGGYGFSAGETGVGLWNKGQTTVRASRLEGAGGNGATSTGDGYGVWQWPGGKSLVIGSELIGSKEGFGNWWWSSPATAKIVGGTIIGEIVTSAGSTLCTGVMHLDAEWGVSGDTLSANCE